MGAVTGPDPRVFGSETRLKIAQVEISTVLATQVHMEWDNGRLQDLLPLQIPCLPVSGSISSA